MQVVKRKKSKFYLFFLLLFLIVGCAPLEIKKFKMSQPIPLKIPIKVGIYIKPDTCNRIIRHGDYFTAVGKSMCKSLDVFFNDAFESYRILNNQTEIFKDLKVIISLEVLDINIVGNSPITQITIKWSALSPSGKIFYLNSVIGVGRGNNAISGFERTRFSLSEGFNDSFQKLYAHMISTKWWESID